MMENFIGKKEKWTNKGTDKQYTADSLLHSTTSYPAFVPNLIILSQVVAKKSSTEYVHMHYIGVRDGKIENLKKEEK